jgi:hypothetical protein
MKLIKFVMPLLLWSGLSFAKEDLTNDFIDHMSRTFSGLPASATKEWDHTFCAVTQPITGRCMERGGDIVYGEANITIKQLLSSSGKLYKLCVEDEGCVVKSDAILSFDYSGHSKGKKQCFPGNFFCGWEWEDLSPGGRVEIRLRADLGTQFSMWVDYYAYPGHDDKPNGLAADAARSLKPKAREVIQQFLWSRGMPIQVVLQN